jgi:hypothetical protein
MSAEPGREALRAMDQLLAAKPKKDGHAFSRATGSLSRFRNEMASGLHAGGPSAASRERLARLNSVIAVVMGGHFPLGEVPWEELEKARDWLDQLVSEVEGAT